MYAPVELFRERNTQLDDLLAERGRDPRTVKRSLMAPFAWAEGNEGLDRLDEYIEAGCQRFMLQYVDYDNLDPIETWASNHLTRFHGA